MQELGALPASQAIEFSFNTHKADGTPIALAGTPLMTVRKMTTGTTKTVVVDLGGTLAVDGAIVGKYLVTFATTDAFFTEADYEVYISQGTVNAIDVSGTVVATFSIEHRQIQVKAAPTYTYGAPSGLIVTGALWAGYFDVVGFYNGRLAYQRRGQYQGNDVYVAWNGTDTWQVGITLGGAELQYTLVAPSPVGTYTSAASDETIGDVSNMAGNITPSGIGTILAGDQCVLTAFGKKATPYDGPIVSANGPTLSITVGSDNQQVTFDWAALAGATSYLVCFLVIRSSSVVVDWWEEVGTNQFVGDGGEGINSNPNYSCSPITHPSAVAVPINTPVDVRDWKGATAPAMTGDAFASLATKVPQTLLFDSDGTTGYHVRANVHGFLGSLLTGTAATIVAAWSKLFNIATPANTVNDLATSANQTTILARLGTWTGTGINNILGAIRAMVGKKAALTPTDLTADANTFDNTTDSMEAIREKLPANLEDLAIMDTTGFVTYGNAAPPTPPTPAAIATATWRSTTATDFNLAGSIGKSLAPATLGTAPGATGGIAIVGSAMDANNLPIDYMRRSISADIPNLTSAQLAAAPAGLSVGQAAQLTAVEVAVDVKTSTRLATSAYTAPANASIASILSILQAYQAALFTTGLSVSASLVTAYKSLGMSKTFNVYESGVAITPAAGDKIRATIVRGSVPMLTVGSDAPTVAGSSFVMGATSTLRLDASDLTFAAGVYSLLIDYYDLADAAEWKCSQRFVFVLEDS